MLHIWSAHKFMMRLLDSGLWVQFTWAVSIGFSNTGSIRTGSQLQRMKLVMKNPPHTAHISHSRLKECRLVLSGTRALPLRTIFMFLLIEYCVLCTWRVVYGKYSLHEKLNKTHLGKGSKKKKYGNFHKGGGQTHSAFFFCILNSSRNALKKSQGSPLWIFWKIFQNFKKNLQ